ncbi:MAG: hypothetical protein SH808_06495 [Saprospiraceae bacterium]|nr:hypothetical protein [Saprospiraceae bacterium]
MKKTIIDISFKAGVALLLVVYLMAFVYSPIGVPHLHHEDEVHQGDSCEKDACHIAIFHPGSKGACNHKFHFTQATEECDYCNVILPRQVITAFLYLDDLKTEIISVAGFAVTEWTIIPTRLQSDRGPPSFV